ncbi:MAG: hypothetical protein KF866_09470 [Phycisphaeraceae bacterium]|nr:hypothetical protein [Phycisphaeraceae bacterium]MCW5754727.1 hypothetical protein [Phycisphaeraceae bacterium]
MPAKKTKPYKLAPDKPVPKARPARSSASAATPPRFRPGRPLLLTALAMGLLAGMVGGIGVLEERAASYRTDLTPRFDFAWPTAVDPSTGERVHLIPENLRAEIVGSAHAAIGPRPGAFDPAPLERLGRMLDDSGWFEGSPTIRRGPDGVFRIAGTWRTHVAGVRFRSRDYLVTADARMMPVSYAPEERQPTLRVVMNPRFDPPRTSTGKLDYRRPWEGDDVKAGLALLAVLRNEPFWTQIVGVDLSRFDRERILVIVTDRGSRIEWGAPVGEFAPGQIDPERRLQWLRSFYNARGIGHIDQGLASYSLWDLTRQVEVPASSLHPPRR